MRCAGVLCAPTLAYYDIISFEIEGAGVQRAPVNKFLSFDIRAANSIHMTASPQRRFPSHVRCSCTGNLLVFLRNIQVYRKRAKLKKFNSAAECSIN